MGSRRFASSLKPRSHVFRLNGAMLPGFALASPTGQDVWAMAPPAKRLPVRRRVDAPVHPTGSTTPLSKSWRPRPSLPTKTSGTLTLPCTFDVIICVSVSPTAAADGTTTDRRRGCSSSLQLLERRSTDAARGFCASRGWAWRVGVTKYACGYAAHAANVRTRSMPRAVTRALPYAA